ncbi:MAG: excisionase family protein, partial [Psychrobacter sp.]|nr:excisionase family protein [Psychrobacter sp.]
MDITSQPSNSLIDQLLDDQNFISALKRRVAPIKWVSKEIFSEITGVSLGTLKNRREVWTEGLVYYMPESSSEYVYSIPGYYQWLDEQAAKDFPQASKSAMVRS